MEWSQVVWNESKWCGMKSGGTEWVQAVWNKSKWYGMKSSHAMCLSGMD